MKKQTLPFPSDPIADWTESQIRLLCDKSSKSKIAINCIHFPPISPFNFPVDDESAFCAINFKSKVNFVIKALFARLPRRQFSSRRRKMQMKADTLRHSKASTERRKEDWTVEGWMFGGRRGEEPEPLRENWKILCVPLENLPPH